MWGAGRRWWLSACLGRRFTMYWQRSRHFNSFFARDPALTQCQFLLESPWMPGSKHWSSLNDKPWSYFNDSADEDLVDFPREEIKRAEALEPVRHIGLHKRGVFCLWGASCWSQSRPSRWSTMHNVLFVQFELLGTKQAEICLKIYVSWLYTIWRISEK